MGILSNKLIESFNYQVNEADASANAAEQELLQSIMKLQSSSDPADQELAKKAMAKFKSSGGAPQPSAAAPKNPRIGELQTALKTVVPNLEVDGIIGPKTRAAARANPAITAKFPDLAQQLQLPAKNPKIDRFKKLMQRIQTSA